MVRKRVGMPMVTTIRATIRPRRFRSSMNRVAIIPPVGIHDPRRSGACPRGIGAADRSDHIGCGGHSDAPNRLVTCRNHDSSEVWISWSRYTAMPPPTRTRLISAITSRPVPAASVIPSPVVPTSTRPPMVVPVEQCPGPGRLGAFDLHDEGRPGQEVGDGPLADDLAPVHDGHRVTGPLDLVEEVGGEHDGATLGHQGQDHVPHVLHPGRVQPVHRFVQDQELRVSDQAGRHPEALTHAHRVLRHLVIGPVQHPHPFEGGSDPLLGLRLPRRGQDLEVLPPGEMAVEPGLVDDGADPGQSGGAMPGYPVAEQCMVPASALVSPSSTRMSVVFPAPLGPR